MTKLVAVDGETKKLDRFELVAELASGGMATVYLARLSGVGGFQRFVAIKRLHPHLAREAEFIQMFLDEARLAARIHHPNVVPILEIGQTDGGYYLVMEYVEGDTLGRFLARAASAQTKIPPGIGVRMILDTLAGLHAAHELTDDEGEALGLVHRDVSPQNILVGVDGSARITDFGVARATSRLSTTRTGQLKGKLAYMAPEQAKAAKDVDRRADVFAMGTVTWELLACKRLFKGDGEADTLNRVLNDPIPTLRSANPTIPAALEAVVARALERDREKRYASCAEFADALERAARVVGALSAHRDVAKYVDEVIGNDISAQREAVRAWLARSEPSQHPSIAALAAAHAAEKGDAASQTKVEGGRRAGGEASQPSSVSSASAVVAIPPALTSSPSMASRTPPPAPPPERTGANDAQPRARRRVWPWAATLVLLIAGGVTFAYMRFGGFLPPATAAAPAPPPSPAPKPPPQPAAPQATTATAAVATGPATDSAASAASAAPAVDAAAAATAKNPRPWGVGPNRHPPVTVATSVPTATATAAPTAAPPPDDISKNPYR